MMTLEDISATEKKAWNGIENISTPNRASGPSFTGDGSTPTIT